MSTSSFREFREELGEERRRDSFGSFSFETEPGDLQREGEGVSFLRDVREKKVVKLTVF